MKKAYYYKTINNILEYYKWHKDTLETLDKKIFYFIKNMKGRI